MHQNIKKTDIYVCISIYMCGGIGKQIHYNYQKQNKLYISSITVRIIKFVFEKFEKLKSN